MTTPVEIKNLSFSYTGNLEDMIFSDISFNLDPGEVFCLLGPNGSGKSTLLKCIAGLLKPSDGCVLLDSMNSGTMGRSKIAQKLGFVPQSLVSAFPFTVEDIVVMGRASRISMICSPSSQDKKHAQISMERTGIAHLAKRPCNMLSGGEWQLVLIARALTQAPGLLLLDEPTSHLDLGNQIKILEVVEELSSQGMGIIMASHFPDHAFLSADKVGILKNKSLIASGAPDIVVTEEILEATYEIRIKVLKVLDEVNRKICIPVLNRPMARSPEGSSQKLHLKLTG